MKLFLLLFLMDTLPLMECCLSRQMFSWLSSVPEEDLTGCPSTCLSLCVIFIFFSNRSFWSQNAPLPKIIPLSSTLVCHNNHSWLQLYQLFNCQQLAHVACLFLIWGKVKRGQYRRWSNRPIFTGPRCLWGPVYGSRCLSVTTRPLVETLLMWLWLMMIRTQY